MRSCLVENHIIHDEYIEVLKKIVEVVIRCKKRNNRIIDIGTTVVKSLETASIYASNNLIIELFYGYFGVFIISGYRFRIVDVVITNFHLLKSTLIMLVTEFAGYHNIFFVHIIRLLG